MIKEEKRLKKLICLFVLLSVFLFIAAGCSSQSSSSDGKVTLKFFHRWPKEPEKSYFEEAVKEFEAAAVQDITSAESMVPWFDMDVDVEIADVYAASVQQMLGGTMTPQQVMKAVQKAAQQVKASAE
ncbi:hypothetical protein AXI59_00085 [Bacillus nakamurai]|nr:hypothetical protein AXI59_00085 [Bacillus nakamurai]